MTERPSESDTRLPKAEVEKERDTIVPFPDRRGIFKALKFLQEKLKKGLLEAGQVNRKKNRQPVNLLSGASRRQSGAETTLAQSAACGAKTAGS